MLDGDNDTLFSDSVVDLRGVLERLKSFDKFLCISLKDVDDVVLANHNESLLDFNESCMSIINKSNATWQLPINHEGILEKILAKPVLPVISTASDSSSSLSIGNATSSRLPAVLHDTTGVYEAHAVNRNCEQEHSHSNMSFASEEQLEGGESIRAIRRRRCNSGDNKDPVSDKSSSMHSCSKNQRKLKERSMNDHDMIKVLHHQQRGGNSDPISGSLHRDDSARKTVSSSKGNMRQGLNSSIGSRSDHGDRRMTTTKSKYQDFFTSKSEHVPTSRGQVKMTLGRKCTRNDREEGCTRGKSGSPSCPRPQPSSRRSRTMSPKRDASSSSRDCRDETRIQSHRFTRKHSSDILRSRSSERTSIPSRRTKKPLSSENLVGDAERPHSRLSRSSEDIVRSSRDNRIVCSGRRRLKSRGSHEGALNEQSHIERLKQRDSLQSFFSTHGGSGITTPATQRKRLVGSGELSFKASHNHQVTPFSNKTRPCIKKETMDHLMLDLRRETGRSLIQKFKPTRNLQAGIMDDILS